LREIFVLQYQEKENKQNYTTKKRESQGKKGIFFLTGLTGFILYLYYYCKNLLAFS